MINLMSIKKYLEYRIKNCVVKYMIELNDEPYDIKFMSIKKYLNYQIKNYGIKHMIGLTDSGYPRFLALGYCDHIRHEIVICREFLNPNLLYHEIGHEVGLTHSTDKKNVMYPNLLRGSEGIDKIIDMYSRKYTTKAYVENIQKRISHEC
jgi:hypothetical protein